MIAYVSSASSPYTFIPDQKLSDLVVIIKGEKMLTLLKKLIMILMVTSSVQALADDVYKSPNGETFPWCTENAIDPDNDGWGWENEASCKVGNVKGDGDSNNPSDRGVDNLPIVGGLPTYGTGRTCGRYGHLGRGRGRVCCTGDFFYDDDDDWSREYTYVARTEKRRYFASAGSRSCARNKTVLACAFENPLAVCEASVQGWGN